MKRFCVFVLVARKAHMPADCHSFLSRQPHKPAYHIDAFFAVTVGQGVVDFVVRHFLPLTGFVVVGVAVETYKQMEGSIIARNYKKGYSRRR